MILRVVNGVPNWYWWSLATDFIRINQDTDFVVGGDFVTVLVLRSNNGVVLFENGKWKGEFGFTPDQHERWSGRSDLDDDARFMVQHLDAGTAVDVELSHLTILAP
jgi:hypothetical protein